MFGDILKIMFFEVELSIKVISFCVQCQPVLEIRIRNHSRTRFDAKNPIEVSYLANELMLKIKFFEISPIVSICVKF